MISMDPPPTDEGDSTRSSMMERYVREIRGKAPMVTELEVEHIPSPELEPLAPAACPGDSDLKDFRARMSCLMNRIHNPLTYTPFVHQEGGVLLVAQVLMKK